MATGKGSVTVNDILKLFLNATAIANVADNAATSPNTNVYASLHTATLSAASTQTSSEAAYTGYSRVAIARTTGGFTAASGGVSNLVAIASFPACTAGSETETYAMLGKSSSGAGVNWYWGPVAPTLAVANGVTPQLDTTSTIMET